MRRLREKNVTLMDVGWISTNPIAARDGSVKIGNFLWGAILTAAMKGYGFREFRM